MTDRAVELVKEFTTQLLTLAVGVFGLVGGYIATIDHAKLRALNGRPCLLGALACFAISCIAGLTVLMRVINLIEAPDKSIWLSDAILGWSATAQVLLVGIGSLLFLGYLFSNLWKP